MKRIVVALMFLFVLGIVSQASAGLFCCPPPCCGCEWVTVEKEYKVCVPVCKIEERECTVMVPHEEIRQGVKKCCKMVPVTKTRTVCEDQGHWETVEKPVTYCCLKLTPCGPKCEKKTVIKTCKKWIPNIVKVEKEYTCYKCEVVEVPYEYKVIVCKPETCIRKVRVCTTEVQTRTCKVLKCVPKCCTKEEEVADEK